MKVTLIKIPDDGSRIHIQKVSRTGYHVTRIYPAAHELTHAEFRVGVSRLAGFMSEWGAEGFIDADNYLNELREGAAV